VGKEPECLMEEGEGRRVEKGGGGVTSARGVSNIKIERHPVPAVTPVAGPIFGPLSQTYFSKSEFKNEISSSALLDIQNTLLCVCGVDSFIPELVHLIGNPFHGLFSKKKPLKSDSWVQIHELKLRSTSSAEANFAEEIT